MLSPILFDVYIDGLAVTVLVEALGLGVMVDEGEPLSLLLYAVYVVKTADTYEDLQNKMNAVSEFCRQVRPQLREGKTKMVIFGRPERTQWHHSAVWRHEGWTGGRTSA